jgi:hypothetical protein
MNKNSKRSIIISREANSGKYKWFPQVHYTKVVFLYSGVAEPCLEIKMLIMYINIQLKVI